MKIAVFEVEEWEQEAFSELQKNHEVSFTEQKLTVDSAEEFSDAEIVSTFIYSNAGSDVLKQFGSLKMVATRSTGYDHIDMDYCRGHDIVVANVPEYGDNTVAEHVFGLLLTISHNLFDAIDRTRRGDFSMKGLRGFDLEGKRFGVIGTGTIGQYVIKIAKGFGMEVVGYDVKPDEEAAEKLGFTYLDMDELLSTSDIITLHVPANPKTRHMISHDEFQKMKDGAILINTARGNIVNSSELLHALAEGKLKAVGLDVLPEEPVIREEAELLRSVYQRRHNLDTLLADHVLLRLRNVFITPHSAFYTREAVQRILTTTVENIRAFAEGEARHVVDGTAKKN